MIASFRLIVNKQSLFKWVFYRFSIIVVGFHKNNRYDLFVLPLEIHIDLSPRQVFVYLQLKLLNILNNLPECFVLSTQQLLVWQHWLPSSFIYFSLLMYYQNVK